MTTQYSGRFEGEPDLLLARADTGEDEVYEQDPFNLWGLIIIDQMNSKESPGSKVAIYQQSKDGELLGLSEEEFVRLTPLFQLDISAQAGEVEIMHDGHRRVISVSE